jgi:hypothetical protein
VRREVTAAGPTLIELAAPLMSLADPAEGGQQSHLTLLMVRLLDGAMQRPEEVLPNPFAGLPPEVLASAAAVAPLLIDALRGIARRLAVAGAKLDPEDDGVLVVLAQLVLLDVDLDRPAAAIVEDLNVLPPGWVDREASDRGAVATYSSRHAGRRERADLDALAASLARQSGLPHITSPQARGLERQTATRTRRLRAFLVEARARTPGLSVGELLAVAHGREHPELRRLREELGWDPDRRTLERNWPKLRQ